MSKSKLIAPQKIKPGSPEAEATVCKVLSRIQDDWGLSNREMASWIHARANTYGNWLDSGRVPIGKIPLRPDMETVVALISIHRSLSAMFSSPDDQVKWLRAKHPNFNGLTPEGWAIRSSEGLYQLKSYLDFARGHGA